MMRPVTIGFVTGRIIRSEEHTSELQSRLHLVCRLLLEQKKLDAYVHLIGLANPPFDAPHDQSKHTHPPQHLNTHLHAPPARRHFASAPTHAPPAVAHRP